MWPTCECGVSVVEGLEWLWAGYSVGWIEVMPVRAVVEAVKGGGWGLGVTQR